MNLAKRTDRLPFLLDDILNTDWFGGMTNTINKIGFNSPAVNIIETDTDYTLKVAAPGLSKDDFDIELDNEVLTISSKKDKEVATENEAYTRKEFEYSNFKRAFKLPDTINSTEILASYEQGVLAIQLPKKEEAKVQPKRSIDIS